MTIATIEELNRRTGEDRRARADAATASGLLAALERREIEVLYQPQYAAADGRLIGAEALARWHHPEAGVIGGEELFRLAKRAGRIEQVSRFLARTALAAGARWTAPLRLSLNVTAADLAGADFPDHIEALLGETGFAADRLTLEITEQTLVAELSGATRQLKRLADRGIHIALDDFGAGFCNFGYLKQLPLHALKLDRSMVQGIVEDARDLAVLRGIVGMAHALGLDVVAEGIETEAQRAAIAREGCVAWQGFLGAEPMSETQFAAVANGTEPRSAFS
ncbi:MAG: EAL domain-containing protein [Croceibacterium sp.]